MTDWKRHLAYGFGIEAVAAGCLFFWQYTQLNYVIIFEGIIIMLISPLVMDLDHRNSKLREVFVSGGIIGALISFYAKLTQLLQLSLIFTVVSFFICYLFRHRGLIHSIPVVVVYSITLYYLTNNINLAIIGAIGAYSHLFFDKEYFKLW